MIRRSNLLARHRGPASSREHWFRFVPGDEIASTLDANGKTKGLAFDPPSMVPYCGKTVPVKRRVERFIDEGTGKLVQLKSDCYILDGVVCTGDRNDGKWFCRRAIYPWWREAWLQPVDDDRE